MREKPLFDSMTNVVLTKDLIALDAAFTMSPTMLTALRVGAGEPSVPWSFGAMRLLLQKELAKSACTETPNQAVMCGVIVELLGIKDFMLVVVGLNSVKKKYFQHFMNI